MKLESTYIHVNGIPVKEPDSERWMTFMDKNRKFKLDEIEGVSISTVFLGINHQFGLNGPPLLWETMIFGGLHDGYQRRYSTQAQAEEGHELAIKIARGEVKPIT